MGQRSQIYISIETSKGKYLVARYYQWNYGSRMVSRARGLIEWIANNTEYLPYELKKLPYIADINFDFKDVVISTDCIEGYVDWDFDIFYGQDNNDGKLFISCDKSGKIKYAFTDSAITKAMHAESYMKHGDYSSEENQGSNLTANCQYLSQFEFMKINEVKTFCKSKYINVPEKYTISA